jgi:predicted outer membrane repeat protein
VTYRHRFVIAVQILLLFPAIVLCQAVVKVCDSDTSPGQNLSQAIATGGVVYFKCPAGSRIRITQRYTVTRPLTLDGGGTIILDGQGILGPFLLVPNAHLILRGVVFTGFKLPPSSPIGSAFFASVVDARNGSTVEVDHSTFEVNESPVATKSDVTIEDSTFAGNTGLALSAAETGVASVQRTNFRGNEKSISVWGGSIIDSTFIANSRGALTILFPTQALLIRGNVFQNNQGTSCIRLSQLSGRNGSVKIKIRANHFVDNNGSSDAGAITVFDAVAAAPPSIRAILSTFPPARFEVDYNQFLRNKGALGGAVNADLIHSSGMRIWGGSFIGNSATANGGAISWTSGSLEVGHALFRKNVASKEGGAVYGSSAIIGTLAISNTVMAENTAVSGTIKVDAVKLTNVTIAKNEASGLISRIAPPSIYLRAIENSIFMENKPRNCENTSASSFGSDNVQFPNNDCGGVRVENPYLDSIYVPSSGSPALVEGNPLVCRNPPIDGTDLVFQGRDNPKFCALGAYERSPLRILKPLRED